jgi:lysozyme family protein
MANFLLAHKKTLLIEGGYVNDPADRGGETYMGVARKFHPTWGGWGIIDSYKKTQILKRGDYINNYELDEFVEDFYEENFWDINRLSKIESQEIAEELFDTGVNMGVKTAAKMLQEALNLLNRNEKSFKDLKVDGAVGRMTLSVVNAINDYRHLLKTLNGLQFMRYVNICKANPTQERFFIGWLKRV